MLKWKIKLEGSRPVRVSREGNRFYFTIQKRLKIITNCQVWEKCPMGGSQMEEI